MVLLRPATRRAGALAGIAALAVAGLARGAPPEASEYRIKAAYLYQLSRFVDWEAEHLGEEGAPFELCVLGRDPFGELLDSAVEGKRRKERAFRTRRFDDVEEAEGCSVVFVAADDGEAAGRILSRLARPGVLTVGESEGFAHRGGVVELYRDSDTIRFRINLDAADAARLFFPSAILELAETIRPGPPAGSFPEEPS